MLNRTSSGASAVLGALIALFAHSAVQVCGKEAKLKPEELVAKHLASIGTPEARAAARNRVLGGTAQVIFRLPSPGQLNGLSNIISDGKMLRIEMRFAALEYQAELLVFDGSKVTTGQIRPGERSNLSDFVYQYDVLLKEGLLGGAATTAWPLLDLAGRQAKLDYSGLKKIAGKQLHELKYRPKRGGGDLQVALYFDPETFRHVSSLYRLVQPASMGRTPTESAGQRDTIKTFEESFDDFKTVDSLTLPHASKWVFTIEGQNRTVLTEYNLTAEKVLHNQQLDPKSFAAQ